MFQSLHTAAWEMQPWKEPTAPNVTFSEAECEAPYVVSKGNK